MICALHDAGVEFLVVGGLSAVLNGVPVSTFDVDVVHRRTAENVDRIIPVLEEFQPGAPFASREGGSDVDGASESTTKYGPLDSAGDHRKRFGL